MGNTPACTNKLAEPGVMEIVNHNTNKIEPCSELVDNALMHYNMELRSHAEQEPVLENYEINDVIENKELTRNTQNIVDISIFHQEYLDSDDKISAKVRSITKQKQVFDFVYSWDKEIKKKFKRIQRL